MDAERLDERPGAGLVEVLKLSWPASLTMLNNTLMTFVDGFMVSRVGPVPFAAQFVGGIASFAPVSFLVGLLTVVNTFVSQNLGAGRHHRASQYAWAGIGVALLAGAALAPLALVARQGFALAGSLAGAESANPALLDMEAMYFRYMILGGALTLSTQVLHQFFYGIHRPRIVFVASLASNLFNVGANAVLIFGLLGFPRLELEGAAIGTVLGWALHLAILLPAFLSRGLHAQFATRCFAAATWRQCAQILRLGWPAGVQLCNDVASWAVFTTVLIATFGEAHLAATTVAMRWMGLSFMPAVGIGTAATALVGRYIGEGRPDLARRRAHAALLTAMAYMGLCGLAFWALRLPMVSLLVKESPGGPVASAEAQRLAAEIVRIGAGVMLCAAAFQLFDAVGIVYIGALRGAGDTFWPMWVTVALSWGVILGGGYLFVRLWPQLQSIGPWVAGSAYVILTGVLVAWRFESGAWRRIDLLDRQAPAVRGG